MLSRRWWLWQKHIRTTFPKFPATLYRSFGFFWCVSVDLSIQKPWVENLQVKYRGQSWATPTIGPPCMIICILIRCYLHRFHLISIFGGKKPRERKGVTNWFKKIANPTPLCWHLKPFCTSLMFNLTEVKTTAPRSYLVRPSAATLGPEAKVLL